jgi:hypothetical protein
VLKKKSISFFIELPHPSTPTHPAKMALPAPRDLITTISSHSTTPQQVTEDPTLTNADDPDDPPLTVKSKRPLPRHVSKQTNHQHTFGLPSQTQQQLRLQLEQQYQQQQLQQQYQQQLLDQQQLQLQQQQRHPSHLSHPSQEQFSSEPQVYATVATHQVRGHFDDLPLSLSLVIFRHGPDIRLLSL